MFNRKYIIFITLFFTSLACNADDSVWKRSHDMEAKGDYEGAAAIIKPWAASDDEYATLRYASLKYLQGEYNESIEYYEKAIKLNPKSLSAKLGITLPQIAQGRWRQVKIYTRQVLVRSDWDYTAHQRLMMAEEAEKKWHSLGKHADELVEIYPADTDSYLYLARARAWMGNTPVAKKAYVEVLHRSPDNLEAETYVEENK
ncbi:MAG: tetratricopeptide repeat protein [Proteobacteria bacterium]|nr:tetratricopeptide repeat protein [Pseudomonadota bacterium]